MKKILFFYFIGALFFCGCSKKKSEQVSTEQMMFQLDSIDKQTGQQRMQVSTTNQQITVNGNSYDLYINRAPSDSLPAVRCETGMFSDNRIVVRILRSSNKSVIFSKTFTKCTFSEYLSEDFLNNGILEGLVYDSEKSDSNKTIMLAASVSFPLSDLYIPFSIKIANGTIASISKDENFDEPPTDEKQ